jgi:RNA polymerase sigma-32 factor
MTSFGSITKAAPVPHASGHWPMLERAARSQGMLSRDQERRLAMQARLGDQHAFDCLVRAHIPLVFAMAFEFRSYGLSSDELLSEGLVGLVKAARDFDPERGTRLATYAAFWIRALMRSYSVKNRRIVRGPSTRNARKVRGSLRRTERELEQRLGARPDAEAIATALNVPISDVQEVRAVLGTRDVAYGPEIADGGFEMASDGPSPEAAVVAADEQRNATARLSWALSQLEPRARCVLERRYLDDGQCTFADLGRELSLSRERVRQIEVQAKRDVRAAVAARYEAARTRASVHRSA